VNINGIERDPRPVWTERSAGAKPTKLERYSWLCEVQTVIDGTGMSEERKYWTEVLLHRMSVCNNSAELAAQEAAEAWYDETDQSGGECRVVFKVTAWSGEVWTVEIDLKWELRCTGRKAARVEVEPARVRDGGGE
jgi:hypothetical protein